MEVAKTYVEGVALLTSGRADFMRLGPASYVSAKQRKNGLELLAVEMKPPAMSSLPPRFESPNIPMRFRLSSCQTLSRYCFAPT